MSDTKICSRCNIEKPLVEFSKNKNRRDGLEYRCKECDHKRRSSNPKRQVVGVCKEGFKICLRCNIEKPLNEFSKNNINKDGLSNHCKKCRHDDYEKHKIESKEYSKKYYEDHLEESKKQRREYYNEHKDDWAKNKSTEEHREMRKSRDKKYRETHQEERRAYAKKYRKEHKEEIYKLNKAYNKTQNGKAISARRDSKRRSRNKNLKNDLTLKQWNKIIKMQDNKCAICGEPFTDKDMPTRDHIIPVSNQFCPGLTFGNVQAAHHKCNTSKGNKTHIAEFFNIEI